MNRNKMMLVLAAVAAVAIVAGGLLLGIQPQLAQAASDRAQRAQIEKTNDVNRAELARLQAAQQQLPALREELTALRASVPSSPDTAAFMREVYAVATESDVTVSNIATGNPVAYSPPKAATEPVPSSAPMAAATAAPTADASPATPVAPAAVTDPKVTSANFSTIQMSIAVKGNYDQALRFTSGMQHGSRLFLVNGITTGSGASESAAGASEVPTWTLTGFVYVLQSAASAQAPQPTSTPSATATPAG